METESPIGVITTTISIAGRDFDPMAISRLTGLEPTEIWRQRLEVLKNNPNFPLTAWRYRLKKRPHWSIDSAIRDALAPFVDSRRDLVSFMRRQGCKLELSIVLYGDETVIVYGIEAETIRL